MKKYSVEVKESLSRVVKERANSYEEAEKIVRKRYEDDKIELDWKDLSGVTYDPYPSQKISKNFDINILFDKKSNKLFINGESEYGCKTKEDLLIILESYINNNVNLEPVKYEKEKYKIRSEER